MRLSCDQKVIDSRAEIAEEAILKRCVVLGKAVLGADTYLENSIVTSFEDGRLYVTLAA